MNIPVNIQDKKSWSDEYLSEYLSEYLYIQQNIFAWGEFELNILKDISEYFFRISESE